MVTVAFKKQEEGTVMTLVHSDLPNTDGGRGHEDGWNYFLNIFLKQFERGSRTKALEKEQITARVIFGNQTEL
jgi:hypothetical protein